MPLASPPSPSESPPLVRSKRPKLRPPAYPETRSPVDYAPISTAHVTKTSLFTYSSQSSLASVESGRAVRSPPKIDPTPVPACDSPDSIGEGVRLPTTALRKERVAAVGAPPPTPPPVDGPEPVTPERKRSDGDSNRTTKPDSPRRSLRRIRGSISEGRRTSAGSDVFLDDEGVFVDMGSTQKRRDSLTLHHPKLLRSSPKSAYLEEERRRSIHGGVSLQAGEARSENSHETPAQNPEDADNLSSVGGGVKLKKQRIVDKDGRKVTPWPTPKASSVVTTPPLTPCRVSERRGSPQSVVGEGYSTPVMRTEAIGEISASVDSMRREAPWKREEHTASTGQNSTQHQSPLFTTEGKFLESEVTVAAKAVSGKKDAILIYEPPDQTPRRKLPALTLIPATPQALPPAAEAIKQLGAPMVGQDTMPCPVPIPENEAAVDTPSSVGAEERANSQHSNLSSPPVRPSVTAVPDGIRDSKLHPWWRPKIIRYISNGGIPGHPAGSYYASGATQGSNKIVSGRKPGRKVKRIAGTNLEIEFLGWHVIRNALRKRRLRKEDDGAGAE